MNIVIYGKPDCAFCTMAKHYLDVRNKPYDYRELDVDFVREDLLEIAPNARSYPQIFVNGQNIGGFNELTRYLLVHESNIGVESPRLLTE